MQTIICWSFHNESTAAQLSSVFIPAMAPTAKRGSHALESPTLAAQVFPKSAAPVSCQLNWKPVIPYGRIMDIPGTYLFF